MALRDRRGAALALCVALALVHTWPLVTAPSALSRTDSADGLLNQWILAWNAHALVRQPLALFHANIFHPEPRTLAFSEHLLPQTVFSAPIAWLGGSPVLAYNVTLWAGLALSAWAMWLVVRRWTGDTYAGLLAGSVAAFNAETLTRMAHIQAMHLEFLPLALLALDRVLGGRVTDDARDEGNTAEHRSWRDAVALGGWSALQMLCSGYLLAMTGLAIVAGVAVRASDWLGRHFRTRGARLALAGLVVVVLTAPILHEYYRVRVDQGLARSLEETREHSAVWQNYLATGARVHLPWSAAFFQRATSAAFPGVVVLGLGAWALASGLAWRDRRARLWLAAGVTGAILSFGPALPGYELLARVVPVLQGLRAPARFTLLPLLATGVLAAFALAAWRARMWRQGQHTRALLIGLAAVVLVNVENARAPMGFVAAEPVPAIYDALAQEPDAVVAELPFPVPERVAANARAVYASTRHWRPILNGYSGFTPRSYVDHYRAFASFPDPSALDALRRAGVTHIVVHVAQAPDAVAALQGQPEVRLLAADTTRRIYRIVP